MRDAYENLRTNDQIVQLYRSGYLDEAQQDRDISEYAYQRGAASLLDFLDAERSYRATQLAYRQALAAYLARARTASRSRGNEELAMRMIRKAYAHSRRSAIIAALVFAAFVHGWMQLGPDSASADDVVFLARLRSPQTPQLFTIPQDQMSHVQVVTVAADEAHAHAAADGRGGLQRVQDDAGDHPGGRPGEPDSGGAGPARETRASRCWR